MSCIRASSPLWFSLSAGALSVDVEADQKALTKEVRRVAQVALVASFADMYISGGAAAGKTGASAGSKDAGARVAQRRLEGHGRPG